MTILDLKMRNQLFLFGLCILIISTSRVFAMGGGSEATESIPNPSKDFKVEISDRNNLTTEATRVTWNGKIYFTGKRGLTEVNIPFDKISSVELNPGKIDADGFIPSVIKLKDGQSVDVSLEARSRCYGETAFGFFKAYLRDLKSVRFID